MMGKLRIRIADLHPTNLIAWVQALPRWQLVGAMCVIGIGGSAFGVGLTAYTTHAKRFCLSCHQYQRIDFEGQANLHPSDVVCADCHQEGHTILPTQFSADAANVRVQCVNCHSDVVTDEQRDYQYNEFQIRITHRSHLAREGVTCTTCHYNVAHDRRENPTNRPTMDGCFRCHEPEKQDCGTCHPSGSLATPSNGREIEPSTCNACHLEWESRSYSQEGSLSFRHVPHLAGGLECEECHSIEHEHGQLALPETSCSAKCHSVRPASHGEDWLEGHGPDFESKARDCASCHSTEFCRGCHGAEMPHPEGWEAEHPKAASHSQEMCMRCHAGDSCQECHATQKPASHTSKWLQQHGQASRDSCARCHVKSACIECHSSKTPASHTADWIEDHTEKAKSQPEMCNTCHGSSFCQSCHGGIDMPHPEGWVLSHKSQASFERGASCFRCHRYAETCAMCHGETPPEDG